MEPTLKPIVNPVVKTDEPKKSPEELLREREDREKEEAKNRVLTPSTIRRLKSKEYLETKNELKGEKPKKDYSKLKAKLNDFMNPRSEYRGAGRLLQLTGTDKYAEKFLRLGSRHYSVIDTLEKDELIVKGKLSKFDNLDKDINTIKSREKRIVSNNLSREGLHTEKKDKTYSAWELLCSYCT